MPKILMNLEQALDVFKHIIAITGDQNFHLAGSARRGKKENLKDLDIIYLGDEIPDIENAIYVADGPSLKRIKLRYEFSKGIFDYVSMDIHIANKLNFGSTLLYFTGSREFNINMRKNAMSKGWKLNRHGLFNQNNELIAAENEIDIFSALEIPFVNPVDRTIFKSEQDEENQKLINTIRQLAIFHAIEGDHYRSSAYFKASSSLQEIGNIKKSKENNELICIDNVGNSIAAKIIEFFDTGKIHKLEKLKETYPVDVEGLLSLEGVGYKSLFKFYKLLGIETLDDLKKACKENKIANLQGFGLSSQEKILNQL